MISRQSLNASLAKLTEDVWNYDDDLPDTAALLNTQLKLRIKLQPALEALRRGRLDSLRKRDKKVVGFLSTVFTQDDPLGKCTALRQIQAHALLLCAFALELKELPGAGSNLNYFIDKLEKFVHRGNVIDCLYRHNIVSVVDKMVIDGDSFKTFQRFLARRPTFPAFTREVQYGDKEDQSVSSQQNASALKQGANVGQETRAITALEVRKHPRDESSMHSDAPRLKHRRLRKEPDFLATQPFSTVARPNIPNLLKRENNYGLPELIHEGLTTSIGWKQELEEGGLDITQCVWVYLPDPPDPNIQGGDAFILFQVSEASGWKFHHILQFGQTPSS